LKSVYSLKKQVVACALTSSFAQVSVAELRVFRSCVCFGFLGLALFLVALGFLAFET
jgi:hypothetical protein